MIIKYLTTPTDEEIAIMEEARLYEEELLLLSEDSDMLLEAEEDLPDDEDISI